MARLLAAACLFGFVLTSTAPATAGGYTPCPGGPAGLAAFEMLPGPRPIAIELEPESFRAGERVYDYLLDHLATASAVARTLGLATYEIESLADGGFKLRDRDRLEAKFRELARRPGLAVYLGEGRYKGRLLGSVSGRALVIICYQAEEAGGEVPRTSNRLEVRVRFDNPLLHAIGRLFGFILRVRLAAVMEGPVATARHTAEAIESSPAMVHLAMADHWDRSPAMSEEYRRHFGLEY